MDGEFPALSEHRRRPLLAGLFTAYPAMAAIDPSVSIQAFTLHFLQSTLLPMIEGFSKLLTMNRSGLLRSSFYQEVLLSRMGGPRCRKPSRVHHDLLLSVFQPLDL